ncbi:hypothetical protein HK098_007773 [Nowakowskiella sp. JEL0407]|nr:hypothetical protein HK098_007773 [Nowakowskiella sp. JEL0407]
MPAHLPDDVLLKIIEFVPRNALSEFSRSCRRIHNIAIPKLYHDLAIRGGSIGEFCLKNFSEIINSKKSFYSNVVTYTRKFQIHFTDAFFNDLDFKLKFRNLVSLVVLVNYFKLIPGTRTCLFDSLRFIATKCGSSLRVLSLDSHGFDLDSPVLSDLADLLYHTKSLQTLSLKFSNLIMPVIAEPFAIAVLSLSTLQELAIDFNDRLVESVNFPFGAILTGLGSIPSFKTLTLGSFKLDSDSVLRFIDLLMLNRLTTITFREIEFEGNLEKFIIAISSCTSLSTLNVKFCSIQFLEQYFTYSTKLVPNLHWLITKKYVVYFSQLYQFPNTTKGLKSFTFFRDVVGWDPLFYNILKSLVDCKTLESLTTEFHRGCLATLVELLHTTTTLKNLTLLTDYHINGTNIQSLFTAISVANSLQTLTILGAHSSFLLKGVLESSDCARLEITIQQYLTFHELVNEIKRYENSGKSKPKRLVISDKESDPYFNATMAVNKTPEIRLFPLVLKEERDFVRNLLGYRDNSFDRVLDGFGWKDIQTFLAEFPDCKVRHQDGRLFIVPNNLSIID